MKLFKTVDEKFAQIGFNKIEENEYIVHYQRQNKDYSFIQTLCICHKANGKHIVQSYDENLTDTKGIGNTCVGLTEYELKLCLKKMKQLNWKPTKYK